MTHGRPLSAGVIALFLAVSLNAQTFDLKFVLVLNDGTNHDVKLQIEANGSTFGMGDGNLVFTYDSSALSNPTIQTAHNFSGGLYSPLAIQMPAPNKVSVNMEYVGPSGGGTIVQLSFIDVVTVRFTTKNVNGNSNLQWNTNSPNPTNVFKDDHSTQVFPGVLANLNNSPLPVQLKSFTGAVQRLSVQLHWTTATEVNNYGFKIERSKISNNLIAKDTGKNNPAATPWEQAGFVSGLGTSSSVHDYSFSDRALSPGGYLYRLNQIDRDGNAALSQTVELEVGIAPRVLTLEQNYPNPFNPSTRIEFTVPEDGRAVLQIYDILGRELARPFDGPATAGEIHQVVFDASSSPSGIYFYTLTSKDRRLVRKMLFLK